jgi:ADP-glucose pyrophosphorylase
MAYVLAGGRGSRLMELTDRRAKPAVYFGGKSRIIDFALSNALNSGIRRIGVATQYKAHSLIRHLQRGWNFLRPERNESFDILPASASASRKTSGMRAPPMPCTRTSTSSRSYGPNTWSSWRATTSTRWTTS